MVNDAGLRDIHDFTESRTREFAGAAGGNIFHVASDPQMIEAKFSRQWQEEPEGTCGVPVPSRRHVDRIPDMAGVQFYMRIGADTKIWPRSLPESPCRIRK